MKTDVIIKNEVIFNSDLYFEHKQWRRELFFWEDELMFGMEQILPVF